MCVRVCVLTDTGVFLPSWRREGLSSAWSLPVILDCLLVNPGDPLVSAFQFQVGQLHSWFVVGSGVGTKVLIVAKRCRARHYINYYMNVFNNAVYYLILIPTICFHSCAR